MVRSQAVRVTGPHRGRFGLAFLLVLALIGALIVVRPGHAGAQQANPDGSVRVIHASPGAPAVDVLVDGQPFVKNLVFGSATDYAPLPEGKYEVQIVPTGQAADNALTDKDVEVTSGNAYIIAVENPLNDIKTSLYEINLDALDYGKARVRVINDSPDAGKIDVVQRGGDQLFGGVDSGDTTDYKDIDAGTYSLDIRKNDETLFSATDLAIKAGRAYDIFAIGQVADNSLALLLLETNVSRPCAEVLSLEGNATESACVRIVHASPGSPAVDVYLNGSPIVQNLAFGTATDYVIAPAGDKTKIQITSTGASLDNAAVDKDVALDAGQAYEFVATGTMDELALTEAELDLTPLPEGQVRVRVVHASPDVGKVDVAIKEGPDLFTDVAFSDVTGYQIIDAGDDTLQVRKAGGNTIVVQSDATFKEGTVYDVIVVGRAEDQSLALLVLAAPATVRKGTVATPAEAGTPVQAGTVTSQVQGTAASGGPETKEAGVPTPTPGS
jgi:hypothetical protein